MFGLFKKKNETQKAQRKEITLYAVCDGELINIEEVNDLVFAQKMMGEGFAIEPSQTEVYSPVSGVINNIFPTQHAFGLEAGELEVLLHMGIDTVSLEGKPFTTHVKAESQVDPQTHLSTVDFEQLKKSGKDNVMVVIFTNGSEVIEEFSITNYGPVTQGQEIGKIILK